MAYAPGLGWAPRIVATRLGSATLAAAGTLSLARWWPFGSAPGEDADLTLIVAGFGVVALALALPRTTGGWPVRAIETSDAVVIPAPICAFGAAYLVVQRPWRRRIELRRDGLVLGAGDEASHIPRARSRRAGQRRGAANPVAGSEWNPRVNGESARTARPRSTMTVGWAE